MQWQEKWGLPFKEGDASMRELWVLREQAAEMTRLVYRFLRDSHYRACTQYYEDGKKINDEIREQIDASLRWKRLQERSLGHENPLLVSVRSGAKASMPGMMDTILNLGLNEMLLEFGWSQQSKMGLGLLQKIYQMYSDVVMEVGEVLRRAYRWDEGKKGVTQDIDRLTAEDLHELAEQFKASTVKISSTSPPILRNGSTVYHGGIQKLG